MCVPPESPGLTTPATTGPPTFAPQSGPAPIIVIGAGLAGTRTVALLRELGYQGRLVIIGAEPIPGYDKPALSKQLLSRSTPMWYREDLGIDLDEVADEVILGDPVVGLVPAPRDVAQLTPGLLRSAVTTASGRQLAARAVIVAVGSEPLRVPGWDGALTLGTSADADELRARLRRGSADSDHPASAGRYGLVVIGSGWIGSEVSGVAAQAGHRVAVVEAADQPLQGALGTEVGARLRTWFEEAGIDLRTGTAVATVTEHDVTLADGTTVHADTILSAVGARPATGWLDGTLPTDGRGRIHVDQNGRVPGFSAVYAVGDCAARPDDHWSTPAAGHWTAALHSPELAVRALLGLEPTAVPAPYVFSTQLGHDLALVGLPRPGDEVIWRSLPRTGWSAAYIRHSPGSGHPLLAALFSADAPREVSGARRLLAQGPVPVDLALLGDGSRALKEAARDR